MSIQEEKLSAIADAIREVDGTDESIAANDFPNRIRSISPGVKSFNGRTGEVVPADGDYTAEQVGALPLAGGTMTGAITKGKITDGSNTVSVSADYGSNGIKISGTQYTESSNCVYFNPDPGGGRIGFGRATFGNTGKLIRLCNIADPIGDGEAANKAYVDSKAGGLSVASNAGAHNSIFRGKNLGTSVTAAQYAAIAAGTFDDLFIGDYWTINNVNWRIAAFDYYLRTGGSELTTHHAVIVPDINLDAQNMNNSSTIAGGYVGSQMYKNNLATARSIVESTFSGHVLIHELCLTNSTSNGKVIGSTRINVDVTLMNERNVFGQTIMSSECANGTDNPGWFTYDRTQFPLFALAPEFIQKQRLSYWLRDVVNDSSFVSVRSGGDVSFDSANSSRGVRPDFLIRG